MAHPTPRERLDSLAPVARTREWIALAITTEQTSAGRCGRMCGCGRKRAWSRWCIWCWREMLALLNGWT